MQLNDDMLPDSEQRVG